MCINGTLTWGCIYCFGRLQSQHEKGSPKNTTNTSLFPLGVSRLWITATPDSETATNPYPSYLENQTTATSMNIHICSPLQTLSALVMWSLQLLSAPTQTRNPGSVRRFVLSLRHEQRDVQGQSGVGLQQLWLHVERTMAHQTTKGEIETLVSTPHCSWTNSTHSMLTSWC